MLRRKALEEKVSTFSPSPGWQHLYSLTDPWDRWFSKMKTQQWMAIMWEWLVCYWMDFSPAFPDYKLCQVSAPTDVGSAIVNVRVLRGSTHPLLRVQNQPQKENQRIEKRTHEDCLPLLPLSTCILVLPRTLSPAGVGPIANLIAGGGMGAADVASKQAPLPGVAETLLGHGLKEPSSCL